MPTTELDHPASPSDLTRRNVVRGAVGTGFAAAVLPVGAQALDTDSNGLTVGEVTIMSGDFQLPASRSPPSTR